jgi:uncharacterized protein (TIGR03435 family)
MNRKTTIILSSVIVVLIAAAIAVKMIYFPSVKEIWFQSNQRELRTVPEGVIVVRPTGFPHAPTNSMTYAVVNKNIRISGRNVTFQVLMATAYAYNPGRISLPPDAPKGNYDFIITGPQGRLRTVVLKRTGYSAQEETQDTDVLALKVEDPYSSGLKASGADEQQNAKVVKDRLYLTHMRLSDIAPGLERILNTPVVDETGLSNYYDFSLAWSRNMRPEMLTREQLDKIVGEWGLRFEPDTESVKMLVVKKTG